MASIVQLKRSALSGKVPDTGSLNLGELAVNTYDGKIYFKKSGSIESVESVVTTNSVVTGSIRLEGTGSFGSLKVNDTLTVNHGVSVISGSLGITSDLTVLGSVNARQFNISIISSSTLFESGSSNFGNSLDDTHTFTGSVNITGSFLLNGQEVGGGTTSGSFTGSFTGDGSGLRGVVSDDLPIDGWDYNSNSSASISEFNNESRKYLIDFQWDSEVGTPIGFKTFISNVTGSSQIIPTEAGIKFIVANQQVALVGPNGIESVPPPGTVSGSSQLTSSYDTRYVLSGSITQTTWDNIASKPNGIISGSSQLTSSYDARYALSGSVGSTFIRKIETYSATEGQTIFPTTASVTAGNVDVYINGFKLLTSDFSVTNPNTITLTTGSSLGEQVEINLYSGFFGTYLTTEDLNLFTASFSTASLVSSITNLNLLTSSLATTGSNLFRGTQTMSGSIIPATDNTYDLGSLEYQWRDIFVSSGSLYIDGTKVLSSTNQELQITTDAGQSIKILEAGSDSIILQSADGDIQLKTSGGGNLLFDPTTGLIDVRGTLQIQDGNKVTSSGGNSIQFGNDIGITGSINTTGNINGVNISTFSSSIVSQISTIQTNTGSSNTRLTDLENRTGSFATTGSNTFFGTQTYSGSVYIANDLIVQGSSSIQYISASSVSIGTNIVQLNTANPSVRFAGLTIIDSGSIGGSGSFLYDSVHDEFIFVHRGNGTNVTSSHFVLGPETYDSLGNETYLTTNRLPKGTGKEHLVDSNITDTGTLITLGSNTTITGTLVASGTTLVSGSSQITLSSTTGYGSVLNQAVLTSSSPTFAGATINGNVSINTSSAGFLTIGATNSYGSISSGGNGATIYLNGATRGGTTTAASNSIVVATDGEFYITNGAANSNKIVVATNGNTTFSGTITENSSIRYKENVETIKYGLDKVLQMRGVTYDKKDNGVKEMGVIAEEIYEVLPEVVLKNEEGDIDSVSYGRITAVLIEAIKDLKKEIEDLKANI
jgi:hypothetical protein